MTGRHRYGLGWTKEFLFGNNWWPIMHWRKNKSDRIHEAQYLLACESASSRRSMYCRVSAIWEVSVALSFIYTNPLSFKNTSSHPSSKCHTQTMSIPSELNAIIVKKIGAKRSAMMTNTLPFSLNMNGVAGEISTRNWLTFVFEHFHDMMWSWYIPTKIVLGKTTKTD